MALHAFVAMPFGTKQGIDFNRVYAELIKPALSGAGFEVFRADEELRAGEIRKDMFQELLLADLVLVDLSIDNPNVWYELGVRHGLRKRGVVQIGCRSDRLPFDVVSDRTLRYALKDGLPDPASIENDRVRLEAFCRETMAAWHGWKVSPVYQLLPYLQEPDWRSLSVQGTTEFWDRYKEWARRVELARLKHRPGDILVLAEETPTWVLRLEAKRMAADALTKLGQYTLALEQCEEALSMVPTDPAALQQKAVLLGRLARHDEARELIEALLEDDSRNPELWSLLGRVRKDEWMLCWRVDGKSGDDMRAAAGAESARLSQALEPYMRAFTQDPRHFYSGVNVVTLRHIERHLGNTRQAGTPLGTLEGGAGWACLSAMERDAGDYWARASYAELCLMCADHAAIVDAYREAVAAADRDWFALDSTRQQLRLLRDLQFRPSEVAAALAVVEGEVSRVGERWQPRRVFMFSGHMIDAPDRAVPRFPPDKEQIAGQAIAARLDALGAGPDDLAICGGACGGDTLFAEAALARGLRLAIHIQYQEPEFLRASVSFAGMEWVDRYDALKAHANTMVRVLPDELGPTPRDTNVYVRNNQWQLYTALSHGPERVRFISLWNGEGSDGPGGTQDMVQSVEQHAGRAYVLDTRKLWRV